jgi:Trk K+ transport system NAD-binding subunit
MEQPVVLCGLGHVGGDVLDCLRAAGWPVVVIDSHCATTDARLRDARLVVGDCRQANVLQEAGVESARGVVIATSDDLVNISTALNVRRLHPTVRIVVRLFNQNLMARLGKSVPNVYALSTSTMAAPLFALTALSGQVLGAFRLGGQSGERRQVAELAITAYSPLREQTVGTVVADHDAVALAHIATDTTRFLHEVDPEARLRLGDRLIVCADPIQLASMSGQTESESDVVRWSGWLRRHARVLRGTLAEIDRAVLVGCALVLITVSVSTLVFYFGAERFSPARALFRTISVMATGADMGERDFTADWLKIFVSGLRVVGAVLMAAFTAVVTNYLLRARLGGAFEVRRIPDGGHVIICGLGNIGYRILEELTSSGVRAVVIEASRDGRFVTAARQLGAAVVIGDARLREVLRQANAASARAVIAATSNDLVNLEVALLVRELNPSQRVVVRLYDRNLAETLREAADVRLALSVPTLAAPAFVAALFGDRVRGVFLVEGRMLAALEITIQASDLLENQTVRAVAIDYHLLPVAVLTPDGALQRQTIHSRLSAGHRLVAIAALPDLERLLRREYVPREWTIDVTEVPLPARAFVAILLRQTTGLGQDEAEQAVGRMPLTLGSRLSRGQAEDLVVLLRRERVTAQLRNEQQH